VTLGDQVYGVLESLTSLDLPATVKYFFPDAKVMRVEYTRPLQGKKTEWHIVSSDQRITYSPVSLKGEREAWLYALQRACRSKWPVPAVEITIQEGL
jgi:hypothetical protein